MPKRTDIKKVMVIGSGPIVIGQAAEFDYAGTQACIALKEEGYEVVLVNSNPATIMTDTNMAHKVYLEPLDLEHVARIVRHERPDGLVCSLGGQTGLNLGIQLKKKGILDECQVEILGTSTDNIEIAEDRKLFKEFCQRIGEPVIESHIATTQEEAIAAAASIGYPVVLRPAFTLGGTGGGFSYNETELIKMVDNALKLSPTNQVLIEKSVKGYKEIEFEVVRDAKDNTIIITSMENIDPVGVHTGDSIVVAPAQTLSKKDYKMLEESALKIVRNLKIEGGCNVQSAINPHTSEYYIIEVNPRLSRSSALASKATAYPIARVATKIACGLTLDEIKVAQSSASNAPKLDYLVAKFPRFPFDKFTNADRKMSTQMKATGEVMSIGSNLEEAFLKSVRSLELGLCHFHLKSLDALTTEELMAFIAKETDERIYGIAEALRRDISVDELFKLTAITPFFLQSIQKIIKMEARVKASKFDATVLQKAKEMGFSDEYIAQLWNCSHKDVYKFRRENSVLPVYKMTENGSGSTIPYYYSTYQKGDHHSKRSKREKVVVLGSGPIRIGQGVEFDYGTVHAIWAIQKMGYEAIVINNNPETVSTDYTMSDKLYFEPLTFEDVMGVIDFEQPLGVVCALGGQTAINLADDLENAGVKILGTDAKAIATAEDRDLFAEALTKLKIPMPQGKAVFKIDEAREIANRVGYPVLVRPSFVLGGRMMHIVGDEATLVKRVTEALRLNPKHPVLVDKYIMGKECEIDAVCDGKNVFIPGIMEHIERAGVHSGDSISVYPTFSISKAEEKKIIEYTNKIGLGLGIVGPYNIQFIIDNKTKIVYVIEVNPRSSRTVPFFAKVTNVSVAELATKVMLGKSLEELGHVGVHPKREKWYVKTPAFSFSKLAGLDAVLSPEMKSTGETIGYDKQLSRAVYKSMKAAGINVLNYGTVFVTVHDNDKDAVLPLAKRFYDIGFNIAATRGTAQFLKDHNIRTRALPQLSVSDEIIRLLRSGHVSYVINTTRGFESKSQTDGARIRWTAAENKVPTFTCLDTVKILLDVIEDITIGISTINS